MKPTVLLDVDGVVANFVDETLLKLRTEFDIYAEHDSSNWPVWSIADYTRFTSMGPKCPSRQVINTCLSMIWNNDNFAAGISPYDGAVEGVESLMEIADVYFVTSPIWTSETWTYDRALWLRTYFGIDNSHIIFTSSKHLVRGDIFVDDRPETVEKWKQHNSPAYAVVWNQPYNQGHPELIRTPYWSTLRR